MNASNRIDAEFHARIEAALNAPPVDYFAAVRRPWPEERTLFGRPLAVQGTPVHVVGITADGLPRLGVIEARGMGYRDGLTVIPLVCRGSKRRPHQRVAKVTQLVVSAAPGLPLRRAIGVPAELCEWVNGAGHVADPELLSDSRGGAGGRALLVFPGEERKGLATVEEVRQDYHDWESGDVDVAVDWQPLYPVARLSCPECPVNQRLSVEKLAEISARRYAAPQITLSPREWPGGDRAPHEDFDWIDLNLMIELNQLTP